MNNAADSYYVGVDVGTSSVRAALVSCNGSILKTQTRKITIFNPQPDIYQQDSEEIWNAVSFVVKDVTKDFSDKSLVRGIGFDATCSLVVLNEGLEPISICPETGLRNLNIIMWMDHRAKEEAHIINATNHKILQYVGGAVSLEMQTPKLLWIKKNMKDTWENAAHFFDLPDYLTYKATGRFSRSLCSLVCKWNYFCDGNTQGWDKDFFKAIDLIELTEDNWSKIGSEVLLPGAKCGSLAPQSASHLGLLEGTPVASSLIDAHAGGLALVAAKARCKEDLIGRLGLICGSSTCHMCVSKEPLFVPGVWGPYHNAMVPGCWLNEGGQSATGVLVEHIINTHPAAKLCPPTIDQYSWLEGVLNIMAAEQGLKNVSLLSKNVHVYPDYHGNRSPLADSSMLGMISGLSLDKSEKSLAIYYLATLQALAYGTRQIVDCMITAGHSISSVLLCGGLSNSPLFIQTHADALGVNVLIPSTTQSVLLGSAMLGASASGDFADLTSAAVAMGGEASSYMPNQELKRFHENKYKVFKKMQMDQITYKNIMTGH